MKKTEQIQTQKGSDNMNTRNTGKTNGMFQQKQHILTQWSIINKLKIPTIGTGMRQIILSHDMLKLEMSLLRKLY